jgi:putative tricarboxylic transport membrane protein
LPVALRAGLRDGQLAGRFAMLDALATALVNLIAVQHLAYMMLGITVGLIIGILPGLGGIAGMSLLIPFIYGMDPVSALAMLMGMVAVIPTGDTFTSVLMGIPGATGSQATILDGFPLAKQGQAGRALSAAFFASLLGGLFGAFVLTAFVVIAKPVILAFGAAELFMLAVLGLSVVGVLAGQNLARGIACCCLGLLVGAIGAAPATGETRLDLGIHYLQDGIPLAVLGLGVFAIPELCDLMRRNRPIARDTSLGSGWLQGVKDTFKHWGTVLSSSILGTIIGAIPGLGGGVVDWIAYGNAVQAAKDKSRFGQGDIRGVIAPEASNNSLQGGALLPTILFGIPGSGSMAVFLGGMVLLGIQPGPSMVTSELNLTYTIAWTLALASVVGAGLCFLLAAPIARLTYIPFNIIAPAMITTICFAAFQARRTMADLLLLFALGMLGLYLRRFGWPRPAFLIGFVLADQTESYLYQAVQFYGWSFLTRPGVLIIGLLAALSIWTASKGRLSETGFVGKLSGGTVQREARPNERNRAPQITFTALALAAAAFALYDCLKLSFLGAVFPASTATVMLGFAGYLLWAQTFGPVDSSANHDQEVNAEEAAGPGIVSVWTSIAWFASLFALAALIGFILAIAIFIPAYLLARARLGLSMTLLYTASALGLTMVLGAMLTLDFPAGLLQRLVELPWPLR